MKFFEKFVETLKNIVFSEDEAIELATESSPPLVFEIPDELDSPEGWK